MNTGAKNWGSRKAKEHAIPDKISLYLVHTVFA